MCMMKIYQFQWYFFDELGLAEISKSNPLKIIHSKLDYKGKYIEKNKKS